MHSYCESKLNDFKRSEFYEEISNKPYTEENHFLSLQKYVPLYIHIVRVNWTKKDESASLDLSEKILWYKLHKT